MHLEDHMFRMEGESVRIAFHLFVFKTVRLMGKLCYMLRVYVRSCK